MSTKTIKVNTALFTSPRRSKKAKKTGRLKSDFMRKVRALQAQREKELRTPKAVPVSTPTPDNEFTSSLQFLGKATKPIPASSKPGLMLHANPGSEVDNSASSQVACMKPAPPYSSLKNDVLPTYRQWRSQTRKVPTAVEPCLIAPAAKTLPKQLPVRRKTLRLGKRGRVVGVLVQGMKERAKNRQIRGKMKNTDVADMKTYLRDQNLIKSGCRAPNDVIREIYSQCRLAGGIVNQDGGVLLHNYAHSV